MALVEVFEQIEDQDGLFAHFDRLWAEFKRGIHTGAHGDDFKAMVMMGWDVPLDFNRDPSHAETFRLWWQSRGLSLEEARRYLRNPEKPPALPEILPTEIADLTQLQQLMLTEQCEMEVKEVPRNYPNMEFEFFHDEQKYLTLRLTVGRSGLNNGEYLIVVNEVQGVKGRNFHKFTQQVGRNPFEIVMSFLIKNVAKLRNHRWQIIGNLNGFLPRGIVSRFFDEQIVRLQPVKIDCPETWDHTGQLLSARFPLVDNFC